MSATWRELGKPTHVKMGRLLSSIVYLISLNNSPMASFRYLNDAYAWVGNAKETRNTLGGNLGVAYIDVYRCDGDLCEVFKSFEIR
jgi:hypothetical protein